MGHPSAIIESSTTAPPTTQPTTTTEVNTAMNGGSDHHEAEIASRSSPVIQGAYPTGSHSVEPAVAAVVQKVATPPIESVPEKVEIAVEVVKEPEPAVVPNIPAAKQVPEPVAPVIPTVSIIHTILNLNSSNFKLIYYFSNLYLKLIVKFH